MPQTTVFHIVLLTLAVILGLVLGWLGRGQRSKQEKAAISTSWQNQIDAQRTEHTRLVDQNQSLMEQVSQYQASGKDASRRAQELSVVLKEALARRDHLHRDNKELRSKFDGVLKERQRLVDDIKQLSEIDASLSMSLKDKDDKIFKLSRELDSWHERLPPLIERYRERDAEARQLRADLDAALEKIEGLESLGDPGNTRIDTSTLTDVPSASNDANDDELNSLENDSLYAAINGSGGLHASGQSTGAVTTGDKLQAIKGIGPAIEKTLHELGIFRFSQIAQMSEYDIDRVAQRLKGFRSRIYREDWIGQARELQDRLPVDGKGS